jgi:hypothetical protein
MFCKQIKKKNSVEDEADTELMLGSGDGIDGKFILFDVNFR